MKTLRGHTSRREGLQSFLCFVVESGAGELRFWGAVSAGNGGCGVLGLPQGPRSELLSQTIRFPAVPGASCAVIRVDIPAILH